MPDDAEWDNSDDYEGWLGPPRFNPGKGIMRARRSLQQQHPTAAAARAAFLRAAERANAYDQPMPDDKQRLKELLDLNTTALAAMKRKLKELDNNTLRSNRIALMRLKALKGTLAELSQACEPNKQTTALLERLNQGLDDLAHLLTYAKEP